MKCPKCQFESRDGANFCLECGEKLELQCPQCGKAVPSKAKFCDECGRNLAIPSEPQPKDLSFDEKLDKIQRYLPKGLTEKILSQRDKIEGERKQVTVMFCHMEGFTQLTDRLGPEEAYSIMDQPEKAKGYVERGFGLLKPDQNLHGLPTLMYLAKGMLGTEQEDWDKAIEFFSEGHSY